MSDPSLKLLVGNILKVLYRNDKDWGKILLEDEAGEKHEAVGVIAGRPGPSKGDKVSLHGVYQDHPKYGTQFKFDKIAIEAQYKLGPMIKTLNSFKVKSMGPKTCEKIVENFGESTFQTARDRPYSLVVDGLLSEIQALSLSDKLKNISKEELMTNLWLSDLGERIGVGPQLKLKIFKKWGVEAPNVIKKNPYDLCKIFGVGFKKADSVAKSLGIGRLDESRLEAALVEVLSEQERSGHTFTPRKFLMKEALSLLNLDQPIDLSNTIATMALRRGLYWNEEGDWISSFVLCQRLIRAYKKIRERFTPKSFIDRLEVSINIEKIETDYWKKYNSSLDNSQLCAVKSALINKVSVITGGPGTGKSTVSAVICEVLNEFGYSFALASPTGKASRVLSQKTRNHAQTIHSLLGIGLKQLDKVEAKKKELEALDYVIIDESSMVDSKLFCRILESLPKETSLVFIGDPGQLPSVLPGQILKDLINSPFVSVSTLKRVYRQEADSRIPELARCIQSGFVPKKEWLNSNGIEHFDTSNIESILLEATRLYDFYTHLGGDVQLISPMNKGPLGVINLNKLIREIHFDHIINQYGSKIVAAKAKNKTFYLGERVIFTSNHKDIGLFNGDVGTLKKLIFSQEEEIEFVLTQFSDREVFVPISLLKEAEYAYAITVHKVQGAEFDAVICPLSMAHFMMGSSELLTTAFTRSKVKLHLLGAYKTLASFIRGRTRVNDRRTVLSKIVEEEFSEDDFNYDDAQPDLLTS